MYLKMATYYNIMVPIVYKYKPINNNNCKGKSCFRQ